MKCTCITAAQRKLSCPNADKCDHSSNSPMLKIEVEGKGVYWVNKQHYDAYEKHMSKLEAKVIPAWLLRFMSEQDEK